MAKQINFTVYPQGGDIDKYEVILYDSTGANVIDTKTFTPPFATLIEGEFTGVADDTAYTIRVKSYIGSMVNSCPLQQVSTEQPIVYITGTITGVGKSIVISDLSQSIGCDVTFNVYATSDTGSGDEEFSAVITLTSGETSVTFPDADGNDGVVTSITPTTSGGSTFVASTSCNGTTYIYTLAIDGASSPFLFKYGSTEADTTEDPLTEAEYIGSVDDTFTAGDEMSGIVDNEGENVVVEDFGNTEDKVLFMQVESPEPPFTLWSEVGNPFQQNQPIDASYATGTAVWFKTTRDSKTIYITRSQTSFVGAVIFSR